MNNRLDSIGLFEEDLDQYKTILDNYEILTSDDGSTAYELAKMCIACADRWSEIALNSSRICKEIGVAKTDLYSWAYQKYRILMTTHDFCRVVYRQCSEAERCRWGDT